MKPVKVMSMAGILAVSALFSCTKTEEPVPKEEKKAVAVVSIITPYAEQVFHYGDTVKIAADITSASKMHGCKTLILNPAGDTLYSDNSHEHGTSISVRNEWVIDVNENSILSLKIVCIMDHDGNTCEKTQNIHTQQD